MNPTEFSLQLKSTSSGDASLSKTFNGITNDDITIAIGTAFAGAYFNLTKSTPKTLVLNGKETADL